MHQGDVFIRTTQYVDIFICDRFAYIGAESVVQGSNIIYQL